jgi:hypothetical protein
VATSYDGGSNQASTAADAGAGSLGLLATSYGGGSNQASASISAEVGAERSEVTSSSSSPTVVTVDTSVTSTIVGPRGELGKRAEDDSALGKASGLGTGGVKNPLSKSKNRHLVITHPNQKPEPEPTLYKANVKPKCGIKYSNVKSCPRPHKDKLYFTASYPEPHRKTCVKLQIKLQFNKGNLRLSDKFKSDK